VETEYLRGSINTTHCLGVPGTGWCGNGLLQLGTVPLCLPFVYHVIFAPCKQLKIGGGEGLHIL